MMDIITKLIATISPGWAYNRARARHALDVMASYDAAKGGRRSGWATGNAGPNAEGRGQRGRLREIGRDLQRNNEWGGALVDAIVGALVGDGIIPSVKSLVGQNDPSHARALKDVAALETAMVEHFDTPVIDADGRCDLYGLQALVVETVVKSGECLIRRRWRRFEDGLPLPYQIQLLEPDYLDTGKTGSVTTGPNAGGYMIDGIEFNAFGQRVAYWLYPEHPQDGGFLRRGTASRAVPAADIAHVYFPRRPGAARDVSWLSRVAQRLHDFGDFEDAHLMRQKIAACFAAFEHDADLSEGSPFASKEGGTDDAYETIEPGLIARLPPGKEITFANPPGVDGYATYSRNQLMAVAATSGVAYESLTGDFSGVTYSSARMAYLRQDRMVKLWYRRMVAPTLCHPMGQWFLQAARLQGLKTDKMRVDWTPPRRESVDPVKEVAALRDAVRSGQKSPSEVARELGKDPAALFAELAADFKNFDRLGLVFDSDPRKVGRGGGVQSSDPQQVSTTE